MRTLVWFRGKDLRIADHAPLHAAAQSAQDGRGEVIPLFVLDPYFFADAARRTPSRIQFLLESLASLAANLEHIGSRLIVVAGRSVELVPQLARRWKVDRVVAQSWVAPVGRERDRRVAATLGVPSRAGAIAGAPHPRAARSAAPGAAGSRPAHRFRLPAAHRGPRVRAGSLRRNGAETSRLIG